MYTFLLIIIRLLALRTQRYLSFWCFYRNKLSVKPETQLIDSGFDFVENVNLHVIVIIDDFGKT